MDSVRSSFNITSSTYTNNSVTDDGGVMKTSKSTFNITSSNFTNNSAADDGGVMFTRNSAHNNIIITNSTFTNNNAHYYGGVMYMYTYYYYYYYYYASSWSVNLTDSTFTNNQARHGGAILATGGKITIDKNSQQHCQKWQWRWYFTSANRAWNQRKMYHLQQPCYRWWRNLCY